MLPVIALIGRPNVGKSTLFNRLTRSRDALVADYPGLTRDRQYGFGKLGPVPYLVIDTGGVAGGEVGIKELMVEQTERALREADVAIVMVDGRSGLTAADEHVAELARRHAKSSWLAVNKAEGLDSAIACSEFHGLGIGEPVAISATHGDRVGALMDEVLAPFASDQPGDSEAEESETDAGVALRIAVIGRPNVGKSTLINRLVGEERLVVFGEPGTTRDSVAVPFERDDKHYVLIDTAGVRRKGESPRDSREVQCNQSVAGDGAGPGRHRSARCPGRRYRAGCQSDGAGRGARQGARRRCQQMGRSVAGPEASRQGRAGSATAVPGICGAHDNFSPARYRSR